ncbi:MAG: 16S rRNA (cytidine(1402)-2'-O)-methyltransferase [Deltaproteobacteria bacterium]|nr:16S rRNA (cytidine(1402)-2'-O)-methyltransferase [Deltaproteobacteria bacterium]
MPDILPGSPGTLFVVATPVGNLKDITLRAIEVLRSVPLVACEDTRSAGRLLASLDIRGPRFTSLFEHNEQRKVEQLVEHLQGGRDAALISEAGTPTISDPGYRLVARCREVGIPVVPIPGPCAALAALSASGLPTDKFLFLGFPPRKGARLARFLRRLAAPARTGIAYLPARRLEELLGLLAKSAPDARVVLARELTKKFEEFLCGTPTELLAEITAHPRKGECTLLVYRPGERGEDEEEDAGEELPEPDCTGSI